MNEIVLHSRDSEATALLGAAMAKLVLAGCNPGAFYLFGPLGCGKTTLVRAFCAHLPGGENAEVASPSFTICNEYPTKPPVCHVDLYRLGQEAALPEEAEGRPQNALLFLEWSENLTKSFQDTQRLDLILMPFSPQHPERLDISTQSCKIRRLVKFVAHGQNAQNFLDGLTTILPADFFMDNGLV